MTDEKLQQGHTLRAEVDKLEAVIERLTDPGFFIELHRSNNLSRSMALIATVGVGESCEHELAPMAAAFHAAVVAHYTAQLDKAKQAYADL